VTAITHRSDKSGADLTDAALIRCSKVRVRVRVRVRVS